VEAGTRRIVGRANHQNLRLWARAEAQPNLSACRLVELAQYLIAKRGNVQIEHTRVER